MPVGPVMNGPVRRLVADVDVDTIAGWPEPPVTVPLTFNTEAPDSEMPAAALEPFTLPVTVIVMAVAACIPAAAAPFMLPEMFTVGVEVMLIAADGLVAVVAPVIDPVIVSDVPENEMALFVKSPFPEPPIIFPLTVKLPAVCLMALFATLPDALLPAVALPTIIVFPFVLVRHAPSLMLFPTKFPTIVIVPVDVFDIPNAVKLSPGLKVLAVMIKSQAPVCVMQIPLAGPVIVALGALIFTVPVVAVTVIKLVALALIPAATLADMLPLLKLNVPPDKFPAPEPVDSVSSISTTCALLPGDAIDDMFNL